MDPPAQQRARRHATLAIGLLVCAAFLLGGGALGAIPAGPWILLLLALYALGACLWWAAAALRHRKPDPWAYDPELDNPAAVAAFEGREEAGVDPSGEGWRRSP